MLLIKVTELAGGRVIAETPREVLATFEDTTKQKVITYLRQKAEDVGEEIRFVDDFQEDGEERINFERLMKRRW